MREFDLIVIGGGSGLDVASAAAGRGQSVAVVEKGPAGGTCLNRGCIPSKMLIHRADLVEEIAGSEQFGIHADIEDIDFSAMVQEVTAEIAESAQNIRQGLEHSEQHTLYRSAAEFTDERTLRVDDEQITAEKIVVAAGARPKIPPIEGLDSISYLTSKEALELEEQPDRLIIIGGGYIAAELGHFYGALGTDITIIGRSNTLISNEDVDVRETVTDTFSEKYTVHTGFEPSRIAATNDTITVTAQNDDGEEIEPTGDELLVATGRTPNTDTLAVEKAGIETDDRGFVKTNGYLETTAENVWALGDIAGNYMFKHSANREAQYVYYNAIAERRREVDYTAMPHAIFTSPQVAGVGQTEDELIDADRDYDVGVEAYRNVAMGMAIKDEEGFVKVLADPDNGDILGCHIVGSDASTLLHQVLAVMVSGSGTVADVRRIIHIHPALNEVIRNAFQKV
ncbi:dihydrolipoyl dehydrogenase [Halomicrococcus sp. SG-WS-1]|uniref:dihydrolipoyl dehydrogenase n=1 Tax=Halomicrococcus sp. SG-WS-1 TaxID=3439057 RepID=UPI003F796E4C